LTTLNAAGKMGNAQAAAAGANAKDVLKPALSVQLQEGKKLLLTKKSALNAGLA